ncbi:unnamed protein product [Paramecium primaurelia]|uniref:Uncharacterized protein n=1 Tax=Paramecium primaurelia TaxID=5886 RepID=A0A8S1QGD0_PARPR|nr:unnamed protein product [Paramecium primaurelia]
MERLLKRKKHHLFSVMFLIFLMIESSELIVVYVIRKFIV